MTLITGASGFFGTHLRQYLLATPSLQEPLAWLSRTRPKALPPDTLWLEADLTKPASLIPHYAQFKKIQRVLHLASAVPYGGPSNDPSVMIQGTVMATVNLLTALMKADAPLERICFGGSIDVYGAPSILPIREESPTIPITVHGAGKLAAEHLLRLMCEQRKIPWISLRFTQLFGPDDPSPKAIPSLLKAIRNKTSPTLFGEGRDVRDYLYIEDAARACWMALHTDACGVYNIGSGQSRTVKEAWEIIRQVTGYAGPVNSAPLPRSATDLSITIERATRDLHFQAEIHFQKGIERCWKTLQSTSS